MQRLNRVLRPASRRLRASYARRMFSTRDDVTMDNVPAQGSAWYTPERNADEWQEPTYRFSHENDLHSYPSAQMTTLPNGMRVITEPHHGHSGTVGLFVDTGSRQEDEKTNGVAHYLEHMMFKGTPKRSISELEKEVENMGGLLHAYTAREMTHFYIKVLQDDLEQGMDIVADITQNAIVSEQSVENERSLIMREMQEVEMDTAEVVFDRLHETAFRNCPLGKTILGPPENVQSITREDILAYRDTHYTADRMVVAASGPFEHGQVVQLAEKFFGHVPTQGKYAYKGVPASPFTGSDLRVRFDSMNMAYIAYAFETVGWKHPDSIPLMVINSMLSKFESSEGQRHQYSSSPIVNSAAADNSAHAVQGFNTQYSDTGLFGVYVACEPLTVDTIMTTCMKQLAGYSKYVSAEVVEEAQQRLKYALLAPLETSTSKCEELGSQVLRYGRRIHPAEICQRVEEVTPEDISRVAQTYFHDQDHVMASVGAVHDLQDYNYFRKRSYLMRM